MGLTSSELLEKRIHHALTRRWNKKGHEITDYSKGYNVQAYCVESITQLGILLKHGEQPEDRRVATAHELLFLTAVVGRVAELEGAIGASWYGHYKKHDGSNQIDEFLQSIGYLEPKPNSE